MENMNMYRKYVNLLNKGFDLQRLLERNLSLEKYEDCHYITMIINFITPPKKKSKKNKKKQSKNLDGIIKVLIFTI